MPVENVPHKLTCNKCGAEAVGVVGHVKKKHKKCGGRKPGFPKDESGRWQ